MLKNDKILLSVIILVSAGILTVLGIWLRNSYHNHRSFIVSQADQTLTNVLYDYVSERNLPVSRQRVDYHRQLVTDITERYPIVNRDTVLALLNRSFETRQDSLKQQTYENTTPQRGRRGRTMIPWFLHSRELDITALDLGTLSDLYRAELQDIGIENLDFTLMLNPISREQINQGRPTYPIFAQMRTRPILVEQEGSVFFYADLDHLWKNILVKMAGQLLFALLLVLALIGAFVSLWKTVQKQKKLATLQKTFVNNMTHELKTPISTVTAALEAIQRYGAKDDKVRMARYLDLSRRELEHLTEIVERVLRFNSNDSQGIQLSKTEFDLVEVAKNVITANQLTAAEGTHIELTSTQKKIPVHADLAHVRNILSNLIDNAIKYSSQPAQVSVVLSETEDKIEIAVSDQGIGIPKTYQKDIFTIFFRVPKGEIYHTKGFGLGLAYVKQVVDQHGGSITVSSEENQGSTFTIILPKAL